MSHVVTNACTKKLCCVKVCPQNAFYNAGARLVINPEDCIDCGTCVPECPNGAIFPEADVPAADKAAIETNKEFFANKSAAEKEKLRMLA
jgi:ferredoxin